jgi:chorismate mutase
MRTLTELRRPTDTHIAALGSSLAELRRERLELAEKVAGLTWDLGGLTYEMAVRDHYRLDVLARRAAELQEADAQLGEVERVLAAAEEGIHGTCRACGSVHSRGAAFCWHCGARLLGEARPAVLPGVVDGEGGVAPV